MRTEPLVETTFNDAKSVVVDRFGMGALPVLERVMKNPLRRLCPDVGDVVYDGNEPVCFQAMMLRRLYLGDKELFGQVGGLTCLKNGAPAEAYLDVRAAAAKPRHGSVIWFGNSQNAESAKAARIWARRKKPVVFEGPESCLRFLWRAIRPIECAAYFLRRKVLKKALPQWKDFSTLGSAGYCVTRGNVEIHRLMEVSPDFFDVLMNEYVKTNDGLVCSRTAEEVGWIFGDRIKDGRCVALGAFSKNRPAGYIVARSDCKAKRWQILDWFALRNEECILEALLSEICRFLKRKTPAMMLESGGFPMYIQSLLMKYLPHKREIGHNVFSWGSGSKEFRESALPIIDTPQSWFFGPYDGDECLG